MIAASPPQQVNGQTQASHTGAEKTRELRQRIARLIRAGWAARALASCVLIVACGGPEARVGRAGPIAESTSFGSSDWAASAACADGATEACSLMLGEHAGIVSCYEGARTCRGGVFGPCENGRQFSVSRDEAEALGNLELLAYSTATDCSDNPCNSYCREYNEDPPSGSITPELDPSAPPLSSWNVGSLSNYPPEWVVVGASEPCHMAEDCQFNSVCFDPALGNCSHSVCSTGDPLAPGCNRCADSVCAIEPNCCGSPNACVHDPCEVGSGAPLDPSCDVCVEAVCAAHPECCDLTWNDACVGYVTTECAPLGQSCGCPEGTEESAGTCYATGGVPRDWGLARDACGVFGPAWTLVQVDSPEENAVAQQLLSTRGLSSAWLGGIETDIDQWSWQRSGEVFFIADASGGTLQPGYTFENWAELEPELGVAGRGLAMSGDGTWRDEALTLELDYVCEGPPNTLGPKQSAAGWTESCVSLVATQCGVECPESLPLGLGACVSRVPTELDPNCLSYDLALGVTCEDAGVPQIPVCNHGQVEAPAGLRLVHLPSFNADLSAAVDCTVTEAVPPGRCVTATNCPGLVADHALVVNPNDGTEDPTECRYDDNWTIYQPVACGTPVCEANVYDAAQVEAAGCSMPVEHPLGLDPLSAQVTLSAGVPEPRCGVDEARWGASCYFFSDDVLTWDLALDRCRARGTGWDLIAVNSPAENAWARGETNPVQDVHIGLNDKATEGNHVWSNGSCRAFTNWSSATSEPNNFPEGSEQCVRMTAATGGEWEDKACNDGEHPYVCEGPVQNARGGCASGQIAGPDGNCYAFNAAGVSWTAARDACTAMGPGWGLVQVNSSGMNEFVTSLIGCTPTWLSNPPGTLANWAPAESVDLSFPPYIDEIGFWHVATDAIPRATLCQGPTAPTTPPELARVAGSGSCTGAEEFYFQGDLSAPDSLTLCPTTCALAVAVPDRRIDVEISCAPPTPPALETTIDGMYYEAECGGGSGFWDFFYYDAVTPADSRIEFEIRTASSVEDLVLGSGTFVPIASAHAIPTDTQRCEVDPPSCPIDIFSLLGSPAQQLQALELRVRLIPGTNGEGPLLRDWRVRFSCPPSQ